MTDRDLDEINKALDDLRDHVGLLAQAVASIGREVEKLAGGKAASSVGASSGVNMAERVTRAGR